VKNVEIASDMGESFGNYTLGNPEEVMKLINCAFVACGYHAGDPLVMHQTVKWCKEHDVVLGAHPGFPDLMGFGRRIMGITNEEARDYIIYQVGALKNFADYEGVKIRTAKPHGAFYLWAIEQEDRSQAVLDGLLSIGKDLEALHLPALPVTPLHQGAEKAGLRVVPEIYPGLVYGEDGGVGVKRIYEGDPEEEADLIRNWLRSGKIVTDAGTEMDFYAESIEVHGDMNNAIEIITAIKRAVSGEGVEISPVL
jgi:UPF0271 protein